MNDEAFIQEALALARSGAQKGEVPVGAVIVFEGKILAATHNLVETDKSVTRHAEIQVLEAASKALGNWRLTGCSLYVTLEPCPMCMSAIRLARVSRIIYGAPDPRLGACGSHLNIGVDPEFGTLPEITGGILKDECVGILQEFFRARRMEVKNSREG